MGAAGPKPPVAARWAATTRPSAYQATAPWRPSPTATSTGPGSRAASPRDTGAPTPRSPATGAARGRPSRSVQAERASPVALTAILGGRASSVEALGGGQGRERRSG